MFVNIPMTKIVDTDLPDQLTKYDYMKEYPNGNYEEYVKSFPYYQPSEIVNYLLNYLHESTDNNDVNREYKIYKCGNTFVETCHIGKYLDLLIACIVAMDNNDYVSFDRNNTDAIK